MEAINYLIKFILDAVVMILLLRVWMQWARADFFNPLSQFVVKISNPLVVPFRKIIPGFGGIDVATIVVAYFFVTLKFLLLPYINGGVFDLPIAMYFGGLSLVKQAGGLLFMIMLIMAIMSWVVQGYNPTMALFNQLCEPFLRPIRRIVPIIAGLDLSILVAFLLLNVLNILLSSLIPYWALL
jgi:YggT family protein